MKRRSSAPRPAAALLLAALFLAPNLQAQQSTPDVGTGPNHRAGAPFRAKLSPPFAEGTTLLMSGRVLDAESGKGIAGAVIEAFHSDIHGAYDRDGFDYRGRILTDEQGRYTFETIRPSSYGPAPHIHLIITADGHRTLRTEILFKDERHPRPRPELTPELTERRVGDNVYLEGTFDIRLQPESPGAR